MEGKAGEKSEVRRWSFWTRAFHGEGKRDNVVFVWRDWCVLGLWGPQSDCGTTDSLSDLGTCLFIFFRYNMLKINKD